MSAPDIQIARTVSDRLTQLRLDGTLLHMAKRPYVQAEVVMIGTRRVTFARSTQIPVATGEMLMAHQWVSVAVVEPGVTQQPYDMVLGYGPTGLDARVDAEKQAHRLIPSGQASRLE